MKAGISLMALSLAFIDIPDKQDKDHSLSDIP